jgi:hypothetical protein
MTVRRKNLPFKDIELTLVTRFEDIPDFSKMSREAEVAWWNTHDIAESLLEDSATIRAEVYRVLGIPDPARPRRR